MRGEADRRGQSHPRFLTRVLLPALAITVIGSAATPTPASALSALSLPLAQRLSIASGPGRDLTGAWPQSVRRAENRLDRTSALLATDRLHDAVRAAAALARVPVHVPAAGAARVSSRVPKQIAGTVAHLLGAITTAARQVRSSFRVPLRTLGDVNLSTLRSVDRSRLFSAGLLVATAVDRALPALRAYAESRPVSGSAGSECDVEDAVPALCIGDAGDNTYTRDVALQIDLGGDDVYLNSAGGASVLAELPVSVAIDLGGNDRYEAHQPLASGAPSVQGSANYGIGMLIDAAGDDSYAALSSCDTCNTASHGQGYAAAGVGVLADLAGSDTYRVSTHTGSPTGSASAEGQGYAGLGLGLALDDGGGNDVHSLDATVCWSCLGTSYGLGYARVGGAAISYDDGGTDIFSMRAHGSPLGPSDPDSPHEIYTSSLANGMGYGDDGGAAAQITGSGDTQRVGLAESVSSPHTGGVNVLGFGYADSSGSFGALEDQGGNDTYSLTASSEAANDARIDDTCACPGVRAEAHAYSTQVGGLGASALGGAAIARDLSGDDTYEATGTSIAEASARDDRTSLVANDEGATALAQTATADMEFAGLGVAGIGVLEDGGGDDTYQTRSVSRAGATASSAIPGAFTDTAATSGNAQSYVEGATIEGFGALRDEGGNDAYGATTVSSATADPSGVATPGTVSTMAQAMIGGGVALLIDEGGNADTFAADPPARTPCNGTRGGDMWVDCGAGVGIGLNR